MSSERASAAREFFSNVYQATLPERAANKTMKIVMIVNCSVCFMSASLPPRMYMFIS
jgi:hypothetical protein